MNSGETSTYVAETFKSNMIVYLLLQDKIDTTIIHQYEYKEFGRDFLEMVVDFTLNVDEVLTEEEYGKLSSWDNSLKIYLGCLDDLPSHKQHRIKMERQTDIDNVIKLLKTFTHKVVVNPVENLFTLRDMVKKNEMKKLSNLY